MPVNLKNITTALKTLLDSNLTGYIIQRNAERNEDPEIALRAGTGWIGIYRGSVSYTPDFCGSGADNCRAEIQIDVEIQVASMRNEDAEDKLEDAVSEVLGFLKSTPETRKIGLTVGNTIGYDVAYDYNRDTDIWFHAAIITIKAEVNGV